MKISDIDARWSSLLQQAYNGLPQADFLVQVEELIQHLDDIDAEDRAAEELAYRMRLHALFPRTEFDPASALEEYETLLGMHEARPDRFPAHPFDEGNWFQDVTDFMMWWLAERASRRHVEHLLSLSPRVFDDPDMLRHTQISAYVNLGEGAKALPLLDGYLPSPDAVHSGEIHEADWLHRYDLAAMVYLREGMLEECDATVAAMMDGGFINSNQPMAMVAESLLPLAETADYETSVQRSLLVLEHSFADPKQTRAILQTATFLLLGGLHTQAFNLVHFTEPFIKETSTELEGLYRFFHFATEEGFGDIVSVRFTSPRWQLEHGIGTDPTCAALAQDFYRAAHERALHFHEVNGDTEALDRLNQTFRVPQLNPEHYYNTVADIVENLSNSTLRYDPIDTRYDDELYAFAREMFREEGSFAPEMVPPRAAEDPTVGPLWEELVSGGMEHAQRVMSKLIDAADDPVLDPEVRTILEVFMLANVTFPGQFPGLVGMRALPIAANIDPNRAGVFAEQILDALQQSGYATSTVVHDLFDFTGGLINTKALSLPLLGDLTTRAIQSSRSMDILAFINAVEEAIAIDPDQVDDPAVTLAHFGALKGVRLGRLGNPTAGAFSLIDAALASEKCGDMTNYVARLASAANVLLNAERYRQVERLFEQVSEKLDDPTLQIEPWAQLEGAEATCRFIVVLADPSFSDLWPQARDRFKNILVQVLQEDEDAPAHLDVIAGTVCSLTRELTWDHHHNEAIDLSAWGHQVFAELGDDHSSWKVLGENALALGNAGRDEQSAMVFESLWQRAREAGAVDLMEFTATYLSEFASKEDASPAYADILNRIGG